METRIWTLVETRAVLPVVMRATDKAVHKSAAIVNFLQNSIIQENEQEKREDEIQQILNEWARHILSMGAEVKGLWLVDFDHGDGYYCWKYGESDILYEHGYEGGFTARRRIFESRDDVYPFGEGLPEPTPDDDPGS